MKNLTQTELKFVKSLLENQLKQWETSLWCDDLYVKGERRKNKEKLSRIIEKDIPEKKEIIIIINSILEKM